MDLRALILDTARETGGVGSLIETLKWGQPSYLLAAPLVGTTVRIDAAKGAADRYAASFHCQTSLVETFRELYPRTFAFEGNPALVFTIDKPPPTKPLRHCLALALTYHARKRAAA
jgi:hypothetical protein